MQKQIRKIELLSPAKNLECGIEAILHGADAVYIGAPKFGARATAAVSLQDIEKLVSFAHQFRVKIYVALNTILSDEEVEEARTLVKALYNIGIDALIIQDFAFFDLDLPPIPLHGSTQMNNRTIDKIRLLENLGCEQVVLARELSVEAIREIAASTSVLLEVFVHGALCVSYSGQCYISQAYCNRSANRGVCAQFCRLPYILEDAKGNILEKNKHLLSLKDLNRSSDLETLLDAGVTSFKIEGRLKDSSYVKNITAYYRKKLDSILDKRKNEYQRSSIGTSEFNFTPDPNKSFNRGFIHYFLDNKKRERNMISAYTPKSIGEKIGMVDKVASNYFTLKTSQKLSNGDGCCFFTEQGSFNGFRLNKVQNNRFYPLGKINLKKGLLIYRNFDKTFEEQLSSKSATRHIEIMIHLRQYREGVVLDIVDESTNSVSVAFKIKKEKAKKNQAEQQIRILSKVGDSIFKIKEIDVSDCSDLFLPASLMTEMKRKTIFEFERMLRIRNPLSLKKIKKNPSDLLKNKEIDYKDNVMNYRARNCYINQGAKKVEMAFEIQGQANIPLMHTKYCLLNELGKCMKTTSVKNRYSLPLYLRHKNGCLRLDFDCKLCEMKVYKN